MPPSIAYPYFDLRNTPSAQQNAQAAAAQANAQAAAAQAAAQQAAAQAAAQQAAAQAAAQQAAAQSAAQATQAADFLRRAGFNCQSWSSLSREQKAWECGFFLMHNQTNREYLLAHPGETFTPISIDLAWYHRYDFARQIDAYCLGVAVQAEQHRPVTTAQIGTRSRYGA